MIDERWVGVEVGEVGKLVGRETGEGGLGDGCKWGWERGKKWVVDNEKIENIRVLGVEVKRMGVEKVGVVNCGERWWKVGKYEG